MGLWHLAATVTHGHLDQRNWSRDAAQQGSAGQSAAGPTLSTVTRQELSGRKAIHLNAWWL